MRKNILLCILCLLLLTGCQEKEPTVQELKQQVMNNNVIFDESINESSVQDKSPEYKNLFNKVYSEAYNSLQYDMNTDTFSCNLFNIDDYKKIVQQDTNGFQKDYENMLKLELAQDTVDNYIYSYITNALGACGKTSFSFKLELGQNNSYLSNAVIVNEIIIELDEFYSCSVNYTKNVITEAWVAPEETFELGIGKTLLVSCGDKRVNCYVRVDSFLSGKDAEEFIKGLSSINSTIRFPQNVVVINYTIMNLGTEAVNYEDKILASNSNGNSISYNTNDIIGLEYAKILEPKVETTITNLYVADDSGVLLWYDEGTKTSLKVNILSN